MNRLTEIFRSLATVAQELDGSRDPLRWQRYYLLARPTSLEKATAARAANDKKAPVGEAAFSNGGSRVFRRLGFDLIDVANDGSAVVHLKRDRLTEILLRRESPEQLAEIERAMWEAIDSFDTISSALRIDGEWWQAIKCAATVDAIIELQPLLTSCEASRVKRAIEVHLAANDAERFTGSGVDLSGRHWLRATVSPATLRELADNFFSIQSLHPPLYSTTATDGSLRADAFGGPFNVSSRHSAKPFAPAPRNDFSGRE